MDEELKLVWVAISQKLDKLQTTLDRIEQRQIKTTELVKTIEKEEGQQVQGSFASSDLGDQK